MWSYVCPCVYRMITPGYHRERLVKKSRVPRVAAAQFTSKLRKNSHPIPYVGEGPLVIWPPSFLLYRRIEHRDGL